MTIPPAVDGTDIVVTRSTPADIPDWLRLAAVVEWEFGAPMAESPRWLARLQRHIDRGTAWAVRPAREGPLAGAMWLSRTDEGALKIGWLAVLPEQRRRGLARALVAKVLDEAGGRPVHVVTFGEGHPYTASAEAARNLYESMGFRPAAAAPDGPDGTPRQGFWHSCGE